jgi:DNA-binding transcriptional LysR family regulator
MDVAFMRAALDDSPNLLVHPLLVEPMVVALPSNHALARRQRTDRVEGSRRRNIHHLRAPAWTGILRSYDGDLSQGRVQPSSRSGSTAHYVGAEPCRCRARCHSRARLHAANDDGWHSVPLAEGCLSAESGPQPCIAPRRAITGGPQLREPRAACGKRFSRRPGKAGHSSSVRVGPHWAFASMMSMSRRVCFPSVSDRRADLLNRQLRSTNGLNGSMCRNYSGSSTVRNASPGAAASAGAQSTPTNCRLYRNAGCNRRTFAAAAFASLSRPNCASGAASSI